MSIKFTAFDACTGQVLYSGTTDSTTELKTEVIHILEGEILTGGYLLDGVYYQQPEQPNSYSLFNWTTKQWEDPRTLADIKAQQWKTIKQARTAAEYAGFTWDSSTFDSDALSQQRITGAVTLAQMSVDFTINWTLADNTVRTLNQMEMISVGAALGIHVATIFAHGQALREQIEAATTKAQVEAIVW